MYESSVYPHKDNPSIHFHPHTAFKMLPKGYDVQQARKFIDPSKAKQTHFEMKKACWNRARLRIRAYSETTGWQRSTK